MGVIQEVTKFKNEKLQEQIRRLKYKPYQD